MGGGETLGAALMLLFSTAVLIVVLYFDRSMFR